MGIKASYCYWDKPTTHPYRIPEERHYRRLQETGAFPREYEDLRREYEDLRYTFNASNGVENVWAYEFRTEKHGHPTQKPIKLIEDIVKHSSNEGDLVLDPFLGSGTTAVACVNLNRHFIGIEKEPTYYEIAKRRVEEAQRQGNLFHKAI